MLDSLITSKTRIKLLIKFFAESKTKAYLRGLADELKENTNAIRVELNRFTKAGLLSSSQEGNLVFYKVNENHYLFKEISNLVKKFIDCDSIIELVINKIGNIQYAFLTGNYASGIDEGKINLVLVADKIDQNYINELKIKAENYLKVEILIKTISLDDFKLSSAYPLIENALVLYNNNKILDR